MPTLALRVALDKLIHGHLAVGRGIAFILAHVQFLDVVLPDWDDFLNRVRAPAQLPNGRVERAAILQPKYEGRV